MFEAVKEYTTTAAAIAVFWIALPGAWFTGLFQAVEEGSFFWFLANMMIPPIGVINGLIQWFS